MRRIFIALIVVMFVGGHGLSSAFASFSQGFTNIAIVHSSASADDLTTPQSGIIAVLTAKSDCCVNTPDNQAVDIKSIPVEDSSGSTHCTAHCGIDATWISADLQSGNWNLEMPLEIANIAKTDGEHFRPPIA